MITIRHISEDQSTVETTDGKKYVAESSDGSCKGCGFNPDGPCDMVPCTPFTAFGPRIDGREVIFKEKENEDHEG